MTGARLTARADTVGRVDLFEAAADDASAAHAPLAVRMRPRTLDEVVGQDHLLEPGSPLRRLVDGDGGVARPASVILWGPPGTGKTSIARLLADAVGLRFVALSAVFSGVAELKKMGNAAPRPSNADTELNLRSRL